MEAHDKNETRMRLREEALARRVGEALDQLSAAGEGDCPDAELIAAYHERALQPDEMAQCESHFAGCSRCRKILAVLAASVDAPLIDAEVAHLGELVASASRPADAPAPRKAKVIHSNRFDWRARLLAPAIGVAAVFAVWFAMRAPWRTPVQGPTETLIAQARKSEPPQVQERNIPGSNPSPEAKAPKAPEAAPAPPEQRSTARKAPVPVPDADRANRITSNNALALDQLKTNAGGAEPPAENEKKNQTAPIAAPTGGTIVPAPPPPPPAALAAQLPAPKAEVPAPALSADATANSPARDKQSKIAAPATNNASTSRSTAEMPLNRRSTQELSLFKSATNAGELQIRSPSGNVLWRAGRVGRIELSTDAGRTWVLQTSPSQQDWLAGAAASDTVCWLVGRNGSIARTVDGEHWTAIAPPLLPAGGSSGRLPDWSGVTASSAQAATITSNDNQHYTTDDGGRTWRVQSIQ